MSNLYRVLRLAVNASTEQVECAYNTALDKLLSEDADNEQAMTS